MVPLKALKPESNAEKGQATVEYILLLAIIVAGFLIVAQGLANSQLMSNLMNPLTDPYTKAYQNGHYQARAPDDPQGAFKHPRAYPAPESFRIFYSKGSL